MRDHSLEHVRVRSLKHVPEGVLEQPKGALEQLPKGTLEQLPEGNFSSDENLHSEAQKLLSESKIDEAWKVLNK